MMTGLVLATCALLVLYGIAYGVLALREQLALRRLQRTLKRGLVSPETFLARQGDDISTRAAKHAANNPRLGATDAYRAAFAELEAEFIARGYPPFDES